MVFCSLLGGCGWFGKIFDNGEDYGSETKFENFAAGCRDMLFGGLCGPMVGVSLMKLWRSVAPSPISPLSVLAFWCAGKFWRMMVKITFKIWFLAFRSVAVWVDGGIMYSIFLDSGK